MTTATRKRDKRTYYPSKTFDDDLEAFVKLAKSEGWHFSGIDLEQIARDAVEQRVERGEYVAAEARFDEMHEQFGLAQEARYQRFAAALNAARAAFRGNETIMTQLDASRPLARRTGNVTRETHPEGDRYIRIKTFDEPAKENTLTLSPM